MYLTMMFTVLMFVYQNGQEFYQQALVQEHAAGNLEAAILLYHDAARYSGGNRDLAAHALLGAARCHEKLGQAKALELYEQVTKTYPEQEPHVAVARDRIAALQPQSSLHAERLRNTLANARAKLEAAAAGGLWNVAPGMFWDRPTEAAFQLDANKPIIVTGVMKAMELKSHTNVTITVE